MTHLIPVDQTALKWHITLRIERRGQLDLDIWACCIQHFLASYHVSHWTDFDLETRNAANQDLRSEAIEIVTRSQATSTCRNGSQRKEVELPHITILLCPTTPWTNQLAKLGSGTIARHQHLSPLGQNKPYFRAIRRAGVCGKMCALAKNTEQRCSVSGEVHRIVDSNDCRVLMFFTIYKLKVNRSFS